jgi:hypothetical protein
MGDAPIVFHDLSFVPEDDEVVVGRSDTGTYVVLPTDGAELLARLIQGMSADRAADWYEKTYDEPVDIDDFLDTMAELGFVREAGPAPVPTVGAPWLNRLAAVVFSPVAWLVYAAVVAGWLLTLVGHPDLLPSPGQVFFTKSLVIVQLVITGGQLPLIFLHEGAHLLAGRRLGLPSTLGVSNRLTNIVFETRMNSVLSVPRRQRYLPLLSGIGCDIVIWGLLDLIAQCTRASDGSLSLAGRVALALAFTSAVRIAWQFQLYLRTDLYYVVATACNCHDLHAASMALVRNRLWRLLRRPGRLVDEEQWTERDRRIGRWYGPCIALGVAVFLTVTLWGSVPIMVQYAGIVADRLGQGRFDGYFWDLALSLAMNVANVVALVLLARRKRRDATNRPLATG